MIEQTFKAKKLPRVSPNAAETGLVLRRLLACCEEGYFLQPDPKHFDSIADVLALNGAKASPTPLSKTTGRDARDALEALGREDATKYPRAVGTAMYLGPTASMCSTFAKRWPQT